MLDSILIDDIIMKALREDMPMGDITTDNIIEEAAMSKGVFIAKEDGVLAGIDVAERVFLLLDPDVRMIKHVRDGAFVRKGVVFAEIQGSTRALLKGERTALNLMQRMSGIATATHKLTEKVKGLPVKIVDTRKTIPGLRYLDKYAVRAGGGTNHRFCLSDGVLIKDNHIKAAGRIKKAVEMVRGKIPHTVKIEVETETMEQVSEALEAGADIIMLDNMEAVQMKEAVAFIAGRAETEASGNITLENVRTVAQTGVDIISVGAITHSIKAMDISLRFK